ncbi:MAG: hybrid sensor histidine kinase/response regulator, partial [Spirochaetota bacterium]|nr:hybrid sensor histidine kinase/response regulator [Spirochaetota bacterium]
MIQNPIKILLVDDSKSFALFLRSIIEDYYGALWSFVYVPLFKQAETVLAENEFDVILLDLSLPDKSG